MVETHWSGSSPPTRRTRGCERTAELLDAYVERIVAGEDPELRYPGIAADLRFCLPCAEDLDGLLAIVRATDEPR